MNNISLSSIITMSNCALDRRTSLYLYVPGFPRGLQTCYVLSERSKKLQLKKNQGSVLVAESAHISQKAQFGLVMKIKDVQNQVYDFHLGFRCTYQLVTVTSVNQAVRCGVSWQPITMADYNQICPSVCSWVTRPEEPKSGNQVRVHSQLALKCFQVLSNIKI